MLDRLTIDRLRGWDTGAYPVLSVYLGLGPDLDELRSISARLKSMLRPIRELADSGELGAEGSRSLRSDIEAAVDGADRLGGDLGRGAALFLCKAAGLAERISLPARVRDRAVVDPTPYLGPLEAMLDHFPKYCAVVADRRTASIYRFFMGELEAWEQIGEEEIRKENYGGFSGYEERGARGHAEAVARRLFRAAAARVADLARAGEFELLTVGGNQVNVDALLTELPSDVRSRLAGTFVVDPRTTTPSDVLERCREVAGDYDRKSAEAEVQALMDAAGSGGKAVLGLDRVLDAANQRAIDRLIVNATEAPPGVRCTICGWLAYSGSLCAVCGEATIPVADLLDTVAESTRADGGSVRYVLEETPIRPAQVGALVRFPVAGLG